MAVDTDLVTGPTPSSQPNQPTRRDGLVPSGPAVAPSAIPQTPSGLGVPAGVHPLDRSGEDELRQITAEQVAGIEPERRKAPWSVENEEAFPVNQRAASNFTADTYTLSTTNPFMIGRLKGCVSTKLWVPSAASHGVTFSNNAGDVQQGGGIVLNPGDSIELSTEDGIWIGVISGQTSGTVNVVRLYNKISGGLGIT